MDRDEKEKGMTEEQAPGSDIYIYSKAKRMDPVFPLRSISTGGVPATIQPFRRNLIDIAVIEPKSLFLFAIKISSDPRPIPHIHFKHPDCLHMSSFYFDL